MSCTRAVRPALALAASLALGTSALFAQTISSFTPHGGRATPVTLTGSGFTGAAGVGFNGTPAAAFNVDSDTQISATSPATFTTGTISVGATPSLFNFINRTGTVTTVGPLGGASLPLGALVSFTGAPNDGSISRAGGQTFFFQNMPLSSNTWLYWGAASGGVRLSMNGNDFNSPAGEVMTYAPAQSNPATGKLQYTGVSALNLQAPWGQGSGLCTRFTMQFAPYNGSPLVPTVSATSAGLPAAIGNVAAIPPGSSFSVNLLFEAAYTSNGCTSWQPALAIYDAAPTNPGDGAWSSFSGGFFYENTAPEIGTIANQSIPQGGSTGPVAFTLVDAETGGTGMVLGAVSDNTTLIPNANIAFGGSGTARTVTATAVTGLQGLAHITVTATDGAGASSTRTYTVTVNNPPTISAISDRLVQFNQNSGVIAFTVGDLETPAASLVVTAQSSNTTLVPNGNITLGGSGANRTISVQPFLSQTGSTTITVTVTDGAGAQATEDFVFRVNAPPVLAQNSSAQATQGGGVTITQSLLRATDVESAPANIRFTLNNDGSGTVPYHGQLRRNGAPLGNLSTFSQADINSGLITYQHDDSCSTLDQFTFNVNDTEGGITPLPPLPASFLYNIQITLRNDPPTATNGSLAVALGASVNGQLQGSDTDCLTTDTLSFAIVPASGPSKGTISGLNTATGAFTYTATAGQSGSDGFDFSVSDGTSTATAHISIDISNQPPVVTGTTVTTLEGTPVSGSVSAVDADLPPQSLTFSIDTNGAKGSASIDAGTGQFVYTPDADRIGHDSFTVVASDGQATSAPATVNVEIQSTFKTGDIVTVSGQNGSNAAAVIIVSPTNGDQAVVASGGSLSDPRGVVADPTGTIYVADGNNGLLRVSASTGATTVLASLPGFAIGLSFDRAGHLLVAEGPAGVSVRDTFDGSEITHYGGGSIEFATDVEEYSDGYLYVTDAGSFAGGANKVIRIDPVSSVQQVLVSSGLVFPVSLAIDSSGQLIVGDGLPQFGQPSALRLIDRTSGAVSTVSDAAFAGLSGIDVSEGGDVYAANQGGHNVLALSTSGGSQVVVSHDGVLLQLFGLAVVKHVPIAITFGATSFTYDGAVHPVAVTTNPAGHEGDVHVDYVPQGGGATITCVATDTACGPIDAGVYAVTAQIDAGTLYAGSASTTLTIAKAIGTVTFDNLTYTGSIQTVTAHITEEPATVCMVTPPTIGPGAGSYAVSATCEGTNYDASATASVTIAKAASVVTINPADLHQNFGATHAVNASASPISSGSVEVTYDGSATVPSAAGSYAVVATLVDPNYAGSASAVLVIGDAANITLTLQSSQAMALVGSHAPYTDPVDYIGTIRNVGAPTAQKVHTLISIVRIDDGNTIGEQPIAIDAADVQACVYDPSGWAAQEPGNHNGCPQDYESLVLSQGAGAFNGRPAVTFRYPNVATYDQPLPVIDPAIGIPPSQFSFKRGDYQVHISLVGDDGTVYATAQDGTTVPDAAVAYAGATSGQAEDSLLSTTTLRNAGGRVAGNVIVRVTLSDAAATSATPIPLVSGDADLAYQLGDTYATLPWVGSAADGGLVTFFGPTSGFPLEDGYNATTAGRGIFHREGSYHLRYEVLDAATQATLFASVQTTIVIGPNLVNFALSDLQQVYDGSPRAVSVTPSNVPHTTVYEALTAATCPATPSGSNTIAPTGAGSYCVYVDATGNYVGSARGLLVIAKATTTVSLDGAIGGLVSRAYDGTAQIVTATPGTAISRSVEVRYNGDLTAPTAAGSYSLVATIVDPNIEGSTTGTLVIAINGGATIVLDDDDGTVDGIVHRAFSGSAVAPVTASTTPAVAYAVTYVGDGSTVYPLTAIPPTAAGQYHVVASTIDANYAAVSASGTLVVDAASATIAIDAATLAATYNGQPHAVTATTTPTGLAYSVTYDGSVTPPVDAGSYAIVATVTTPSYTGAASGTLVIAPSTGVVTFGTTNVTFDGQPHTTTAVISQEPADTAACILTATIGDYPRIDAGSTTVSAVCAGSNYTASGSTTLIVSRKPVAIALAGLGSFPYDNAAHAATATVNDAVAGFPATAEVTYDGNAAAPVNVGTYAVLASLDAASQINYSATPSNGSIVIGSANASVTLANLAQAYDGTDRIVTATTVPASLATSITYDGSVSPPVNAGSYTVVATITEAGYSGSTSGTLVVAKASATIGLSDLTQAYDGQPKPVTVATTPAGLAIAVSYDGSATAPIAVGTYAVLAIITDANHTGSTSGTLHIVAAGADAIAANGTTTFAGTAGQPIQGALPSVRVTDSGGNPVAGTVITFAAAASNGTLSGATQITDANGVATLGGWTLDPTPGTDTVVASAAGVIGAVTFTASAGVSTDALTVTITDARNYAQLFTALTYTITIGNATSSSVSGISVTDSLPTELDVNSAHWQCIGINGGTCSASALGDLSDTVSLPSGSSVVYLLSATVIGGSSDTIVNTIDATGPNGPASATDTTSIVLFRNGFEAGSDGAQRIGDPSDVLGVIDAQTPLDLNVEPATLRSLQRITIASDSALRIEAIRIDSTVWVRLVANAGAGEKASLWSPMTGKRLSLRMEQTTVTLAGAVDALSVTVQAAAALTIRGGH